MATTVTRFHPDTHNTADEIWKLEEAGLATKDEIHWRKREDVRTGAVRPAPLKPRWAPLTPEEFRAKVEDKSRTDTDFMFASDGMSWMSKAYGDYLTGFFEELGRHDGKLRQG